MIRHACFGWIMLSALAASAAGSSMRGIDSIGLQMNVRIESDVPVDRVDRQYILNLIAWQLDQYRVNVVPRTQERPFLLVRVQLRRHLGPVQELEENKKRLEGVFSTSVLVEFQQPVVTTNNRLEEFWTATYRREDFRLAYTQDELENTVIRSLERTLLGFIHAYRRANPLPAADSQSGG